MSDVQSMHRAALQSVPVSIVVSDPTRPDNPITFVNQAFTRLTGYTPEMTVGRNCRFLQGPETEPEAINAFREGLASQTEFTVELTNYRVDGKPFRNRIIVTPLFDDRGELEYYVALQRDVSRKANDQSVEATLDEALREVHHRVKNHLSMVVGMIRLQAQAKNLDIVQSYATLARRIETLQFLYNEMTASSYRKNAEDEISLGAYISRIASAISYLDGRERLRLNLDIDSLYAPVDTAAQIGLIVSELLTNAYQHAFGTADEGLIKVSMHALDDGSVHIEVLDDGAGLPPDIEWPGTDSMGGKIVSSLISGLNASFDVKNSEAGTRIAIDVPVEQFSGYSRLSAKTFKREGESAAESAQSVQGQQPSQPDDGTAPSQRP